MAGNSQRPTPEPGRKHVPPEALPRPKGGPARGSHRLRQPHRRAVAECGGAELSLTDDQRPTARARCRGRGEAVQLLPLLSTRPPSQLCAAELRSSKRRHLKAGGWNAQRARDTLAARPANARVNPHTTAGQRTRARRRRQSTCLPPRRAAGAARAHRGEEGLQSWTVRSLHRSPRGEAGRVLPYPGRSGQWAGGGHHRGTGLRQPRTPR